MKTYIYIEVDTNDEDYVGKLTLLQDDFHVPSIRLMAEAIRNHPDKRNFKFTSFINLQEKYYFSKVGSSVLMDFIKYLPNGSYDFHTITDIKILQVSSEENLLNKV